MKFKNVTLLLTAVIVIIGLVGCNTQEKKDAADAERLAIIEEKIDGLFNEEKTDIITDLMQEKIDEIEVLLGEEKDHKFSQDNLKRIDSILMYLDLAIDMVAFELEVDQLFDDAGGLVTGAEIESVETNLMFYENETVFYDRQLVKLTDANEQLLAINEVKEQIEKLFIDGEVKSDVTREQEAEMRELIATLKSADAQRELEGSLVKVAALLSSQERAVASAQREQAEAAEKRREAEAEKAAQAVAGTSTVDNVEVVVEDKPEPSEDKETVENDDTDVVEEDATDETKNEEMPSEEIEEAGEAESKTDDDDA